MHCCLERSLVACQGFISLRHSAFKAHLLSRSAVCALRHVRDVVMLEQVTIKNVTTGAVRCCYAKRHPCPQSTHITLLAHIRPVQGAITANFPSRNRTENDFFLALRPYTDLVLQIKHWTSQTRSTNITGTLRNAWIKYSFSAWHSNYRCYRQSELGMAQNTTYSSEMNNSLKHSFFLIMGLPV